MHRFVLLQNSKHDLQVDVEMQGLTKNNSDAKYVGTVAGLPQANGIMEIGFHCYTCKIMETGFHYFMRR